VNGSEISFFRDNHSSRRTITCSRTGISCITLDVSKFSPPAIQILPNSRIQTLPMLNFSLFGSLTVGILPVLLLLAGCGPSVPAGPETGTVTGVVTLDSKPLPKVMVAFQPEGNAPGGPSMGLTDAEGKYELTYNATTKGAVVGSHKVRVTTPTDAPSPPGTKYQDPIPTKYNSSTELIQKVTAGANVINLDLLSK
jgi:hypothetical protein